MAVFIDAPERLVLIFAGDAAEACTRRIDEYEIAGIKQTFGVVDDLIRRCWRMRVVRGHNATRSERTHVQPHRGRTRSAVEYERDRPRCRADALAEIGGVEHRRFRRRVLRGSGL